MLDIGWAELMVIGVVALIVIGPKDLPDMFRQLGRFMAKIRSMGRDFQRAMDEAARQSGVTEVAKDLKGATSAKALGLDGLRTAADKFEKWDPIKNAAKPTVPMKFSAPLTATPVPMTAPSTLTQASTMANAGTAAVTEAATAAATESVPAKAEAVPAKAVGPETQALMDRQAAKAVALRDYTGKLKEIDAGRLSPLGVLPPRQEPEVPLAGAAVGGAAVGGAAVGGAAKPARKPRVKPMQAETSAKTTPAKTTYGDDLPMPKPRRAAKSKVDQT